MEAPPGEASPPSPRRRPLRLVLTGLLVLLLAALLAAGGGAYWLVRSESGFAAFCSLAHTLSGGRLTLIPAGGTLAGPLRLREARWQDAGGAVRLKDVGVVWSPAALGQRRLDISQLTIAAVYIQPGPPKEPAALPASLRLPLALRIGEFRIGRLLRGETALAEDIAGSLESDGLRHRLAGFRARASLVNLAGEAELAGDAPFDLSARMHADSQFEGHGFALDLDAKGPLEAIDLSGRASGALHGTLAARATPFRPQPFERLQVHLKGIDPALWRQGAPSASLDLDADLLPRQEGGAWTVAGPFTVVNRSPGRLDAKRLPVTRLSGRVSWRGDTATFTDLAAALTGGGSLTGQGRLAGRQAAFDLTASRLDASQLHPRLRPTRLAGPLTLRAGPEEQSLAARLANRAEPRFDLTAEARRRGDRVEVESLQLSAGQALLRAHGQVTLNPAYSFAAKGELARFDPSRFARVPPARLNAVFEASGSLQPKPAVKVSFDLRDSRFRDQPLTGQGEVDLAWPEVRKAEFRLAAGPNRLEAHGAFGRPGDRLDVAIDAPALDPYGIEGGVSGRLQVSGTPAALAGSGRLQAARLGLPGVGRVHGLELQGELGARAQDPLRLDLRATAVDLPERPGSAREVSIQVEGSRARHDLRAGAALAGERHIRLAAAGGLIEGGGMPGWSGELKELVFTAPDPAQSLRLLQPAPLRLAADQWALGPAEVAGSEWRGRLRAGAAQGRLQAEARGQGPRLGSIDASLDARLQGAWSLAQDAPWQGRLSLAAADLAWVGPLLGDDWRTAGQIQGELRLAGTPARPEVTGQVRGERLGLRIPTQGLQLENGILRAELTGDRLQLATLAFDSRLRPLPPAIPRAAPDLARLTAAPGRLEMQGEIELGGPGRAPGPDRGAVDVRLERVGVLQQADQWVAVSGGGKLRWQGTELGAEAKLRVDAGYWELARLGMPKLSDDVVVHTAKAGSDKGRPPATRPKLDLDIETDLGPHFYFSGSGLESRLAGSIRLRASGQDVPRATGTIRTVEGKFDAYGQKLAVERGIINFQGFLDNPSLNVRAVRKGLPVEPGVEVTGPVKRPVVRLVSDPELPEAEKLSWLVLGHGSEQLGGNDASTLLNAATTLLGRDSSSGGVMQQLQRRLGFEDIGLRQGQIGDPGGRQATSRIVGSGFSGATPATTGSQIVTVSRRLSSNVLLSYEQALGRAENIVKLTVNLSRRLSVVGRTGSDNAVDLFYTFSFGK
ncbi:MAG TPA: translocation/assembly module TamB domain-containing protein [Rhodocyclaceae bacterium]|nr:translocation/assembly module TamB domain-containing protein [Rhodocyclaceae bacterium]